MVAGMQAGFALGGARVPIEAVVFVGEHSIIRICVYLQTIRLRVYYRRIRICVCGLIGRAMKSVARSTAQLGSIIHRERRVRGLTQAQLGTQSGLRQATVSKIEKGEPATRLSTLFDILATLNLELTVSSRSKTPKRDIGDLF